MAPHGVQTGLDRLVAEDFARLKGKRIAVLAHEPSVDRRFRHLLDLLTARRDLELRRVFAPEHGLFGAAQDQIPLSRQSSQNELEIVTLYGERFESLWPNPEHFADIDLLVADIQDVGARYYTYATTLTFVMQRAAAAHCPVLVLDRPNPLGGTALEGGLLDVARFRSFVGYWPLLARHGLTVGELAAFVNAREKLGCALEVLPVAGLRREMQQGLGDRPWVAPSPNMPTLDTARVYPGACLIEGTNLSEGRGTTRPFELVGAPFFPAREIARRLTEEGHPGFVLRPTVFEPTFHKFQGQPCQGLQIHVSDTRTANSWLLFVRLLTHLHALDAGLAWRSETYEYVSDRLAIDLLLGDARLREWIENQAPLETFVEYEQQARRTFAEQVAPYRLYD